jgi:Tol biopolymer transport system component
MNAKQMTFGSRNFDGYSGLELTADNKVIFSSPSGSANNLYSINTNGSEKVQLTDSTNRENTYPKVTPDGRFLVFTSNRSGSNQIWRMNVDGTEPIQLTNTDDSSHQAQTAAVSPDGSEVYFIKTGNDSYSVGKTSIDGGVQTSVVDLTDAANISLLSISPDGKWLAYHRILEKPDVNEEESTMRIGLISLENNGETKQFDLPIRRPIIRWSSATTFDYSSGTFNTSAIWRQSISGEKPEKLVEFPDRIYNFAISPDGKNLAVSRGRQNGDAILISNLP